MVDFAGNPYLNDPRFQLSDDQMRQYRLGSLGSALTSFGAGIAGAGASGQPWFAGIAPGAAAASGALNQQEAQLAHMQEAAAKYQQMEDYRKSQEAHLAAQTDKETREQNRKDAGFDLVRSIAGSPPGMNYTPPLMSPPGATGAQGNAIGKIEGDYNSVGPPADSKGSRGLGKYQVMDYNVGPWTKEALGQELTPQQYLASPQAQDAVFNHKFGQYSQKYGPVGAAKAWFAGEGGMNNPNAKDVNGMTVANYGNQFVANGGAAAAPGGAGPTMASLPPFQGAGMGDPAMQPGALPPGAQPQVNLPPPSGAPPGMAVGDGGPPGSPAGAAPPQLAQASAPSQLEPMPQRDPRIRALAMYPEGKALAEQMEKEYQTQLETWKFNRSEATKREIYRPLAPPEARALGLPENVQYQLNTRTNKVEPMTNTKQPRFDDVKDTNGQIIGQRNVDTNQYHPVQPVVGAGLAIDPNLQGEDVYKALVDQGQGQKANEIKSIVSGANPIPSPQSRVPDAIQTRKLVFQAGGPDFTDTLHAQRMKTLTDLNSGKPNTAGYQLQAQGTLFNHLAEAVEKNQEINNSPYPIVNKALNAVGVGSGDPRLAALRVVLGKVNAEGEKAFEGKTTVSGLAKASEDLSATMGTPAFAGAVREYMKLVNGQQTQLIGRINRGLGYKPDDPRAMTQDNPEILTPDARASRDRVLAQTQPNKADNSKLMDAGKEMLGATPKQEAATAKGPPGADFDKYEYRPNPNVPSGYDRRLK